MSTNLPLRLCAGIASLLIASGAATYTKAAQRHHRTERTVRVTTRTETASPLETHYTEPLRPLPAQPPVQPVYVEPEIGTTGTGNSSGVGLSGGYRIVPRANPYGGYSSSAVSSGTVSPGNVGVTNSSPGTGVVRLNDSMPGPMERVPNTGATGSATSMSVGVLPGTAQLAPYPEPRARRVHRAR